MSRNTGADQPAAASAAQWAEHTSADGRVYYYNKTTRVTTWEKPDALKSPQERQTVWKEYSKDGRTYWYNPETKKSTWTRPAEMAAPASGEDAASRPQDLPASDKPQDPLAGNNQQPSASADTRGGEQAAAVPAPVAAQAPPGRKRSLRRLSADAFDEPKAARREFRTAEEAEAAFVEMLRRHKVGGDWTWEQALRAVVNDPDYRSLRTLPERKDAFSRYVDVTSQIEQEQLQKEQQQQRDALFALLDTLPISEHTRLRKVEHLAADHEALRAIPARSHRARLFGEYMDERLKDLGDVRRQVRRQLTREAAEFLGDIPVGAKWDDIKTRLLDRFGDQLMPVLSTNDSRRVPMDAVYYFVHGKGGAVDPEAGLSMLDLMDVYDAAIADAEKRESEQRQKEKAAVARRERQSRDAFRGLLEEHSTQFTPSSTWSEFYPQIKQDPRYTAMLGQAGSTPLELFWDCIELLSDDYYRHRKSLECAMRDHGFQMSPNTTLGDVREFAAKHCDVPEHCMEYIHEQLVIKARRRVEEEEERAQRHWRRLVDDFKYALHDLDPPLAPDAGWDKELPRISVLPEFKGVGDEAACRAAFDAVVEHRRERRQRSGSDARKRSRSRAPADGGADRRTRLRADEGASAAAPAANDSDLEEGEMVDY
ncbi:U1 snRNP protein [Coemansia nantahalensis]|uniref:U1 snRNP protein n=1 Tax=Coemansia nantahalensis TaxID=2789366 RepID=A0ACC1JTI1_9FUNG|nr:U1 snRNP protein [Coemansia nantahalensis]